MIQPDGEILGLDFSEERIRYAREHYAGRPGIHFQLHDIRHPAKDVGPFDLIWVRFFLEYFKKDSFQIVKNLSSILKPGGSMCLLDLDHNCMNHYPLPAAMEKILHKLMEKLEKDYNFDPYSGRKLYAFLYDLGFEDIQIHLMPHHLIYGEIGNGDIFNWVKKVEMASRKAMELFLDYPGGRNAFFEDFMNFFNNPKRFTYTPLILCKGLKPLRD
jgi:SAM-dependent methyltransferase